jgi:hypothetical protein
MLKQLNVVMIIIFYYFNTCDNSLIFNSVQPVSVGDTAFLICNVSNENYISLAWYRVYNISMSQSIWFLNIFINSSYSTRYSVSTDSTSSPTIFKLKILSVQLNEFGDYECRRNGGGASSQGTLSVQTTTTTTICSTVITITNTSTTVNTITDTSTTTTATTIVNTITTVATITDTHTTVNTINESSNSLF